jgi:predicted HAD superfamily Cof-like phosphohydrolase
LLQRQDPEGGEEMTAKAMSEAMLPVIDFRLSHELAMRSTPGIPPTHMVRAHMLQLLEECAEYVAAAYNEHEAHGETDTTIAHLFDQIREIVDAATPRVDLVGLADAAADITYVAVQSGPLFGYDFPRVWGEICNSNASKQPGPLVGGKVQKGPSYRAPDVRSILFPCSPPPLRQEVPTLTPEIAGLEITTSAPREGIYFAGARVAPRYTWEQATQPWQAERK